MNSDDALLWLHSLDYYFDMVEVLGDYDHQKDYVGPEGSWKSKIIPRTIWGIDINVCAYIHDYWYAVDKGKSEQRRFEIDAMFLADMMQVIEMSGCWSFRRNLARMRAAKYFAAVREGGKSIFND